MDWLSYITLDQDKLCFIASSAWSYSSVTVMWEMERLLVSMLATLELMCFLVMCEEQNDGRKRRWQLVRRILKSVSLYV